VSGGVYYSPEDHGLETIGEAQWGEACYDFDLTVVWRNKATGQLYYADDSGCSCPSPFEDHRVVDDLTAATLAEVLTHLKARAEETYGASLSDAADLIERVASLRPVVTA
jgi:hypothetical protein